MKNRRALVADTNLPTNDHTVSDPVSLNALNVPSGLIAKVSVLCARPAPQNQVTRAVLPVGVTLIRTCFVIAAVPLAYNVPSYSPPFFGVAAMRRLPVPC